MASKKVSVADVFPDTKKIFSMGVMLVRGPVGFRKLDYDFVNKINPKKIVQKCAETGFNSIGIVVKDTDGACIWDTQIGWNPTGRDLTGEFCDYAQQYNLKIAASFTNMYDAYQGYLHPERVSVHKNGKIATHDEGEMRVDLPAGKSLADMKELIPFLTDKFQARTSASRDNRGEGYVPLTSFMCPTSPHVDYLCNLIRELVGKYPISGVMADYIRFDGSFTDLCQCPRCNHVFYKLFPGKKIGSEAWRNFREMVIARFGRKFVEAVHSVKPDVFTGISNCRVPGSYSLAPALPKTGKCSPTFSTSRFRWTILISWAQPMMASTGAFSGTFHFIMPALCGKCAGMI